MKISRRVNGLKPAHNVLNLDRKHVNKSFKKTWITFPPQQQLYTNNISTMLKLNGICTGHLLDSQVHAAPVTCKEYPRLSEYVHTKK